MINNNQITSDKTEILKEIFLLPSEKTITHRFNTSESEAAGCSGTCSSGICRAAV